MRVYTACLRWCMVLAVTGAVVLTSGCAGRIEGGPLRVIGTARNPVRITFGEKDEFEPAISMDGSRISFTQLGLSPLTGIESYDIWTCDAMNGSALNMVRDSRYDERSPSWYPDGQWILYHSDEGGGARKIWRVRASRLGGTTLIGSMEQESFRPKVSPDGTEIAFCTGYDIELDGPFYEVREPWIWIMKADGSMPQPLDAGLFPAWSPDGTKLAYCKLVEGQWDVWVISRDGSTPGPITAGDADDIHPCWSPSGREIAYASNAGEDETFDIYIVNSTGGPPTRVTESESDEFFPAWGPGGNLYFCSDHLGSFDIWRVELMPGTM